MNFNNLIIEYPLHIKLLSMIYVAELLQKKLIKIKFSKNLVMFIQS